MRKRSFLLIGRLWNIASWNGDFCHLWTKRTGGLCLSARAGAIRTGLPCLIRSAASLKIRKAAAIVAIETAARCAACDFRHGRIEFGDEVRHRRVSAGRPHSAGIKDVFGANRNPVERPAKTAIARLAIKHRCFTQRARRAVPKPSLKAVVWKFQNRSGSSNPLCSATQSVSLGAGS
jgi:hypothetical protein